jgi:hypothetical protein
MRGDSSNVAEPWESLNKNWVIEVWAEYFAKVGFLHSLLHHCYKIIVDTKMLLLRKKRNY